MMVTVSGVVAREIKKHPGSSASAIVEELVIIGDLASGRFNDLIIGKSYFGGGLFGIDYEFLYLAERRTRRVLGIIPWTIHRVLVLIDMMDYSESRLSGIVYEPSLSVVAGTAVRRLARELGKDNPFVERGFDEQKEVVIYPLLSFSII